MKTIAAILLCVATLHVAANDHPNVAKGFRPNGVYQVNNIDSINAFNGSLTLTIPIGHSFPIGGGLSYQLRLYWNTSVWDAEERRYLNPEDYTDEELELDWNCGTTTAPETCMHAFPDRRANAGLGWTLSLGRLFPPEGDPTGAQWQALNGGDGWTYEGPDGSEHRFGLTMLPGTNTSTPGVYYTSDGTNLRLRQDGSTYLLEFPNGEVHTFEPNNDPSTTEDDDDALIAPWLLKRISTQYPANALTIEYHWDPAEHLVDQWTLTDGYRQHTVNFVKLPFESGIMGAATLDNRRMIVRSVTVAASNQRTATYSFSYEHQSVAPYDELVTIPRPNWHNIPTAYAGRNTTVQLLKTLTLPDGTKYEFDHGGAARELMKAVTLPTGGKIQWTWATYGFPKTGESGAAYFDSAKGVDTRTLAHRDGTVIGTWTYASTPDVSVITGVARELTTTITDPQGNRSYHYFNVYPAAASVDVAAPIDYGKPFTRKTAIERVANSSHQNDALFLTERFVPSGTTMPFRETYIKYDSYYTDVLASRTVYPNDAGAYQDTDNTDSDGLGHYRTSTTTGTGVPTRTNNTDYNPEFGRRQGVFTDVPPTHPWVLNTFTSTTVSDGEKVLKAEYAFDPLTGFLLRTRRVKDTATGGNGPDDVINVFTPDSRGNILYEDSYGGDGGTLCTGSLATLSLPTRQYRVMHTYSNGSLARSVYHSPNGTPLSSAITDADIDATGLTSATRDSAGVPTTYSYDVLGRVVAVTSPGRAASSYHYPTFTTTNGVFDDAIIATQSPNSGPTEPHLGRMRYQVDGIGRITTTWTEMPGGVESHQTTRYDALGRVLATSVLGRAATLPETEYTRDALGRVLSARTPDGRETTFVYKGIRTTWQTSWLSTNAPTAPDTGVTTIQESDLYGRLIRVTEQSGPTSAAAPLGATVVTEYSYDPADRLTTVLMNKTGTVVQQRAFDYDGRGFLRWEVHPESGITSYTYDVRGNIKTSTQGAANSLFDLTYTYDHAGRLQYLYAQNPFAGTPGQAALRVMKEFSYGTANQGSDLRNGKVVTATRYNYGQLSNDPVYKIQDTYAYLDPAGRTTDRTTTITRISEYPTVVLKSVHVGTSYNDLDLPVTVAYPMCTNCGAPPIDPSRSEVVRAYDHGRLISLARPPRQTDTGTIPGQTFVTTATFWANGMRHDLVHGNGIADTQLVADMPRPTSLSFGRYDRCVAPSFLTQPASTTGGAPVTLSVAMSGTGPFSYAWYNAATNTVVGETQTITLNPANTTDYYVTVAGACGIISSRTAKVSVGVCTPPTTGPIRAVKNPDASWLLTPDPTARAGASYTWRRLPGNEVVGNAETLSVGSLTVSTTFSLTISDDCPPAATTSVTIAVPLAITKTALVATASSNQIQVSWPAVPGATSYVVERRSGPAWEFQAERTISSYTDTSIQTGRTYAYRVYAKGNASDSDYSNTDIATTRSFTPAVAGTQVTTGPTNEMLAAVNLVRAAAGWAPVTWTSILAPNDPVPLPLKVVSARHVMSCRARMTEALQALGVPILPYAVSDLTQKLVTASSINDVQARSQ